MGLSKKIDPEGKPIAILRTQPSLDSQPHKRISISRTTNDGIHSFAEEVIKNHRISAADTSFAQISASQLLNDFSDNANNIMINPKDERRMNSDAEFFFGAYSKAARKKSQFQALSDPDLAEKFIQYEAELPSNTLLEKLYKFYRVHVAQNVYSIQSDTNEKVLAEYLSRRKSPDYKVGKWHLVALGVAAVISGEFAGWNYGLAYAGYNGFWIANALAVGMYVNLALCIGEMACSIPLHGGATAFVTCVLGRFWGLVVGNSECLAYSTFICLLCYAITLLLQVDYWPLIWIALLGTPLYFLTESPKWNWRIIITLTVISLAQILVFVMFAANYADLKWLPIGWDPTITKDIYYGRALVGIFQGVFTSAWWFTGFECLAHGIKESKVPKKDLPFALITSCIILGLCALFLSYFNVVVPPDVVAAIAGSNYKKIAVIILYPSHVVNIFSMLWCASRHAWALSRVGYFPSILSIVSKTGIPRRGAFFGAFQSFFFLLCALGYHKNNGSHAANDLFLDATLVCALITYIFVSITYIGFIFYFPDAPRPFKNPFGVIGAGLVTFVSATTVMIKVATNETSRYAFLAWAVYVVFWGAYFVGYRRMHLVPNEDAILAGFFRSFKFRPEMYA